MATTSSNTTVTGTPISNSNNESPATLQRKLIVLTFNLPDNIVTTSPIEDQITVTVDSVDTATFTNPDGTTNTDYLVMYYMLKIVKVVQNLSYCTRSLVGYREVTRTKTTYECFIMPQEEGTSAPQISATYDYDVFINHCNYVVPNIAKMSRRGDGAYARNPPLSSRRQADTRKRSSGWELIRGMILKMVNKLIGSAKRRSIISKICQDLSARKIPYF